MFFISSSPGHDYSFSSLSKIKDNVYINLFDESIIEKHEVKYNNYNNVEIILRSDWIKSSNIFVNSLLDTISVSNIFWEEFGATWNKIRHDKSVKK